MKKGLKCFSKSGVSAIEKEVRQLVTIDALEPNNLKEIRREDCRSAIAYLMLLKEKGNSTIKDRGCCGRIVQRNYMTK